MATGHELEDLASQPFAKIPTFQAVCLSDVSHATSLEIFPPGLSLPGSYSLIVQAISYPIGTGPYSAKVLLLSAIGLCL
jgi:hypothetical protein